MRFGQKLDLFKTHSSNFAWFNDKTVKTEFIITIDNNYNL